MEKIRIADIMNLSIEDGRMIMIRMIAFDLDKTLAELEQAVPGAVVARLQEYENKGVAIALCSGKPAFYLSGFVRQMSLNKPVLIGENGAVVQLGIKLPPEEEYYMEADPKSIQLLEEMKREVKEKYQEGIWLQPNEVELTIFFRNQDYKDRIGAYLDCKLSQEENLGLVDRYDHVDCFDLSPGGINKGTGLRFAAGLLGIPMEEVAAVGDNTNDYPMFEAAGTSVGISLLEPERAKYNVKDINEALDVIDKMA